MKKLISSVGKGMTGFVLLSAILAFTAGCSKDSSDDNGSGNNNGGGPGPNEVYIVDMAFSPASITVTAGTTVKWTNKDGVAHNVTSTGGLFESGNFGNGSSYSHQFNDAGTFSYFCTLHPSMTGTVVVN
jgi:plastocyanin